MFHVQRVIFLFLKVTWWVCKHEIYSESDTETEAKDANSILL